MLKNIDLEQRAFLYSVSLVESILVRRDLEYHVLTPNNIT